MCTKEAVVMALLLGQSVAGFAQTPANAEAALALAKRNDCFKCHAIDRAKRGPAYRDVAARLRNRPDGVEAIVGHITSGRLVRLEDGNEVNHRIIDTTDPDELANFARWLLAL